MAEKTLFINGKEVAFDNEKNLLEVQKNLDDPTKTCVVHMATAVRVGIGEEFGLPSNEETNCF